MKQKQKQAAARFTVGIDLGTSNTVVAYVETGSDDIRVFEVDQLVGPGELAARPLLPSVRYHPAAGELNPGDVQLPWPQATEQPGGTQPPVVGQLARALGAQVPGRLVTSAKSWLSHASVDRLAPILPWGAPDDVAKVSPVAASASYLAHVRAAWNTRFPDAPLEQQNVVLTVPASFDEGARALTLEAARLAKLPALRLLEEPQAAFYDWLFHHRVNLREELNDTKLVLICDVGGGTTDLTLIKVHIDASGEPQLTRIGVGNHLMLGGDNMDLALARLAETRLTQSQDGQARLSAASLSQLVERCRVAKEQLLDADAPESVAITLLGSGSRLIGGARTTHLTRDEIGRVVVDGFFPQVSADEMPRRSRAAIVEFGLPYASDAAVTRHVAAFLKRLAAQSREALGEADGNSADDTLPVPDTLLLNGGVFRAHALTQRLADTLGAWRGEPLHVLQNDHPDVAVARGAVAYGLARAGNAPRIGGGSARSYFLVLEGDQGICLLPRGTEEAHEVHLDNRVFALRLGQPVRFHLMSTVADTRFKPGELTDLSQGDFIRLPPIATVVQRQQASDADERPVKLTTSITEVGTLEVNCIATDDPSQRWLLQFELRRDEASATTHEDGESARHASLDHAIELIERAFGARASNVGPNEVKRLRAQLEHTLGPRENWDVALLRELFGALWDRARRRRRSADHERLWLNLAGYCLRPGFGYPLDEWRVEQLWSIFDDGIQYIHESRVWSEWWTLWRRAAGGLSEDAQLQLLDAMEFLQAASIKKQKLPFDPAKVGYADMIRVQASLERISVERKIALAQNLLERLRKPSENHQTWWAVGRIGARLPFYGSAHGVVPPEVALPWLEAVLALDWKKVEPAAFAAVQLSRMTGDRSRDLPDAARETVIRRLETLGAAPAWIQMVRETVALDEADTGRVFGESLPAGLKLIGGA
ncbi:Hsp70 family protein [Paraburkholderia hospita]|uniref:DnaK-like molecular chaperone n=1 Tax=Paraburkholderia hospita TaxID=169430 RepID=A0AAN1JDC8_9BURK|nr:Hsp70 family protein [Paraburkholderia hospita]AUT71757.1 molecular chaperone DnaK [Paraburkholderia hospita]EIM96104.1 DnaK-like molecular chaperone [Paraburkholderia hospita]OUL71517.1 molecular chaperone DnaK [Paraburkholderia hospita]SEH92966.1 Molecular chaperone DnaK (HSP70) [Paraburkholderia hospita]